MTITRRRVRGHIGKGRMRWRRTTRRGRRIPSAEVEPIFLQKLYIMCGGGRGRGVGSRRSVFEHG
jgi:hypothetical protein